MSSSGFFVQDESDPSNIIIEKSNNLGESEVSASLPGSFPQKFAYYDQNSFFAEHTLNEKKLERSNSFVNQEMKRQENLAIFKKILKKIEKHIYEHLCPLSFLKDIYILYLKTNYNPNNTNNDTSNLKTNEKIINDIDCFLTIFRFCIMDFYSISKNPLILNNQKMKELFSPEAFRYFVINSFFAEEEIYELVYSIEKNKYNQHEEDFQTTIKKLTCLKLKLEDFGVAKEFLLNENPLIDGDNFQETDFSTNNYFLAIDCLKNLQYIKSPVHKLKSVNLCGLMIKKAIEDFYFKKNKKINMNGVGYKEYMKLFFFAVYKSRITNAHVHLNIIKDFVHKNVLDGLKLPFFKFFSLSVQFFTNLKKKCPTNNYMFLEYLVDFMDKH